MEAFQPKEEEENSMHNTVVMFSTSDHFTLKQVNHSWLTQVCGHIRSLETILASLKRHSLSSGFTDTLQT